jgi:putative phosphoesterase
MVKVESALFISDVHSNLEALKAVLKDAGPMPVYCLGDLVGYGASPNEVVNLLRTKNATCVLGNHDEAVVSGDPSAFNMRAAVAAAWTSRHLTDRNKHYLSELPRERTLELGGEGVYMTHGSPDDHLWEYVFPNTHSDMFDFYLKKLSVKVIALGHTHMPFAWSDKTGLVFNPGSVGQPRDGENKASYAVLTFRHGKPEVEHKRVEYDIQTSATKIIEAGLPPALGQRLFEGV